MCFNYIQFSEGQLVIKLRTTHLVYKPLDHHCIHFAMIQQLSKLDLTFTFGVAVL